MTNGYYGAPVIEDRTEDVRKLKARHSKEGRDAACALLEGLGYDPKSVLAEHGSGGGLCWDVEPGVVVLRVVERDEYGRVVYTSGGVTERTDFVRVPEDLLATYRAAIGEPTV